jgi:atypical dual specificity phosphatase
MRPSTWIAPGRLAAGRHPCADGSEHAAPAVEALVTEGVTLFVDLTEEGELASYEDLVRPPTRRLGFPVADFTVPDPSTLTHVLDAIDDEIGAGGVPFVHCWAGCGRTGVVVGCWLVRHGAAPEEALARVERERGPGCPQTREQRLAILAWKRGR